MFSTHKGPKIYQHDSQTDRRIEKTLSTFPGHFALSNDLINDK